ncbi:hypothetical protein TNIN_14281 [Trichonephila inaurata madagascariensis]|uniref:Uncharacterized protein n=1 Tax=Trichonephila inaurata madagascariensis TaxID=2747483 RepID=A0A8X6XMK5_9ARAC|nr:hypothetical protein TNIN_14281 [Trichonephila inaurata madagascariensis]
MRNSFINLQSDPQLQMVTNIAIFANMRDSNIYEYTFMSASASGTDNLWTIASRIFARFVVTNSNQKISSDLWRVFLLEVRGPGLQLRTNKTTPM